LLGAIQSYQINFMSESKMFVTSGSHPPAMSAAM